MPGWVEDNGTVIGIIAAASLLLFVASLVLAPVVAVRIPADYFAHGRRPASRLARSHPVVRVLLRLAKNVAGIILLFAGIAMLVLPGQGLLTLVVGFLLLDFPGKYRVQRRLIALRPVHTLINWLRRRAGRPPLSVGPEVPPGSAS